MRPASSAGGTATAGPKTAAAAWRRRSAGSIGPTTRAARSSGGRAVAGERPRPPTSAARSVSADGRAETRATGPADACTAEAPAATAAVADSGASPPGACTCTSTAGRSPRPPAATSAAERPRAPGARRRRTRRCVRRARAARRARAPPRSSAGRPGSGAGPTIRVGTNSAPASSQARATGPRASGSLSGSVARIRGDAPSTAHEHEAAHQVGREGRVAPAGSARPPPRPPACAGLAQHRPQPVPRALRARLEGRPGAARRRAPRAPCAPTSRERGRGGGEVVGPDGGAPGERGEVAQGRVDVTDGVGGRRHRTPFVGTGNGRLATGLTRGRSTPAFGCRSSAGRPR